MTKDFEEYLVTIQEVRELAVRVSARYPEDAEEAALAIAAEEYDNPLDSGTEPERVVLEVVPLEE